MVQKELSTLLVFSKDDTFLRFKVAAEKARFRGLEHQA